MKNFLVGVLAAVLTLGVVVQATAQIPISPPAVNADVASAGQAITACTVVTTTATCTVANSFLFPVGQNVNISAVTPSFYNGTFPVATVPSGTTFTYTLPASNTGSGTAFGTAVLIGPAGIVTTSSGLTAQVAPGPVFCNGGIEFISKTNLTLPANATATAPVYVYFRCPTEQVFASIVGPVPGVDLLLDTTVTGASTITTNTDNRLPAQFPPAGDMSWWVPLGACGLQMTTGALSLVVQTGQMPGIQNVAANNHVLEAISTAAASAATLDCDIEPLSKLTAGHGAIITDVVVYYGYQGAAALSTITTPTFSTVTYSVPGGAAAGTVAAAGGTINQTVGTSHSTPGAVTTTGQCYPEQSFFSTPIGLISDVGRVTMEQVFNHTAASIVTYQICGVHVHGQYIPF